MSFGAPLALLMLLVIPAGVAAYLLVQRRRARYAVRFTNLDLLASVVEETPGWRRHVPAALYLAALAALLVAVARPQTTVSVPKEQATIMLVTDISGSMNSKDVEPTRLGAAQASARELLKQLPGGFRVGLISFSNTVNTLVQPTTDRAAVGRALDGLVPKGGTAMGDALMVALDDLDAANENPTPTPAKSRATPAPTRQSTPNSTAPVNPTNVIVLLSDGANTLGQTDPLTAAAEAAARGVPIYTIALGTPDGVAEVTDQFGRLRQLRVPPDPDTLRQVADTTGGKTFNAPSAEQLQAVYRDIGSRIAHEDKLEDVAWAFAGVGAAFLVVAAGFSLLWFNRFP